MALYVWYVQQAYVHVPPRQGQLGDGQRLPSQIIQPIDSDTRLFQDTGLSHVAACCPPSQRSSHRRLV